MTTLIEMSVSADGTVVMQSVPGRVTGYIDVQGPGINKRFDFNPGSGWSSPNLPNEVSRGGISLRFERVDDGVGGTNIHFTGDRSYDIAPGPVDFVLEYDADGNATGLRVGASGGVDGVAKIAIGASTTSQSTTNLSQDHLTISPDGTVIRTTYLQSHPSLPDAGAVALVSTFGPTGTQLGQTQVIDVDEGVAANIAAGFRDHCFLAPTPITMWPRDPSVRPRADGSYDEELIRSRVWEKSISEVCVGDLVVSYDKSGRLQPGRVTRTFRNESMHILDFWGTGVTAGHAYLCSDGPFEGRHVPIIDILRTDGAILRGDGTPIRAATGCEVGSPGDALLHVIIGDKQPDGRTKVTGAGQIRLGTRVILESGRDISIQELIADHGGTFTDEGLVRSASSDQAMPFLWAFGDRLPKPEDYILRRSRVDLASIYLAGDWETIGPRASVSQQSDELGLAEGGRTDQVRPKPAPNIPPAFRTHPDAPQSKAQRHTN